MMRMKHSEISDMTVRIHIRSVMETADWMFCISKMIKKLLVSPIVSGTDALSKMWQERTVRRQYM